MPLFYFMFSIPPFPWYFEQLEITEADFTSQRFVCIKPMRKNDWFY